MRKERAGEYWSPEASLQHYEGWMYDFHELSPPDFEELVRDLLQAHWCRRLESFGPGRDRDIDVRYLAGPEHVVVQAKHLSRGNGSALLREAAKERCKAIALDPSRYVLATSVSMSPDLKRKVVAAMAGVPLVEADVFGREDLNNLLGTHPEVERRHFKMWLASAAVLDRILRSGVHNRTAAELDIVRELVPRFVQNQSVADAEAKLEETGALVIAGAPGVGKTTLARMLLWRHAEQGWKVCVVDDIADAMSVADEGERRIIFFDDFLGQVQLSPDHVRGIDARLPPLLSRVAGRRDLRFVLTTRDYILAQAKRLSARLETAQGVRSYVLNVGTYTRGIKARIVYNHIYFSALTALQKKALLADKLYLKMIDHKNFNPRLVAMLTHADYLARDGRPVREIVEHVLAHPQELWERPFRAHMSEDARLVLLAMAVNGAMVGLVSLRRSFERVARALQVPIPAPDRQRRFDVAYREVDGSAIGLSNNLVVFTNPGLRDYLRHVIRADGLLPFIVQELGTVREMRECLSMLGREDRTDWPRAEEDLLEALTRLHADGLLDQYDHLTLALDLYDEFQSDAALAAVASATDAFESQGVGIDDVAAICGSLQRSSDTRLPSRMERRVRMVVASAAATLLKEDSYSFNLDDLLSLDEALFEYGCDVELATEAVGTALAAMSSTVEHDLRAIQKLADLDTFESDLIRLMRKREVPTDRVVREIGWRREALEENESAYDDGDDYHGDGAVVPGGNTSDQEIASLFSSLES